MISVDHNTCLLICFDVVNMTGKNALKSFGKYHIHIALQLFIR